MDLDFQKVWNRVTAGKAESDAEQLQAFLHDEQKDAEVYLHLANCTGSARAKRLFLKLAAEEKEHARRLRSMAYLLGECACSKPLPPQPEKCGKMLEAIRHRYMAESQGAEAYDYAAATVKDARLRSLYARLAEEERRHGEALWKLLKGLM